MTKAQRMELCYHLGIREDATVKHMQGQAHFLKSGEKFWKEQSQSWMDMRDQVIHRLRASEEENRLLREALEKARAHIVAMEMIGATGREAAGTATDGEGR